MKLILILLSLFSLGCSAQVEINLKQLDGTKWRRVDSLNTHREETITFSSRRMTENVVYKKGNTESEKAFIFEYYINSTFNTEFTPSLLGNQNKGSFLVVYNSIVCRVTCYQIVYFSSDKMVMQLKKNRISIGENNSYLNIVYQRVF